MSLNRGLLLSDAGLKIASESEHELLLPLKNVKSLPFNEGLEPLKKLLKDKVMEDSYNRSKFTQTKKSKSLKFTADSYTKFYFSHL